MRNKKWRQKNPSNRTVIFRKKHSKCKWTKLLKDNDCTLRLKMNFSYMLFTEDIQSYSWYCRSITVCLLKMQILRPQLNPKESECAVIKTLRWCIWALMFEKPFLKGTAHCKQGMNYINDHRGTSLIMSQHPLSL